MPKVKNTTKQLPLKINTEEDLIDYYANNVVEFVKDQLCFGANDSKYKLDNQQIKLWEAYQEIILAKEKASRISKGSNEIMSEREIECSKMLGIVCRSCKGPGKSTGVAAIITHFMCVFGIDQLNLATAPKFDQIIDIVFRNVSEIIDESYKILGKESIAWNFLSKQTDKIYKKAGIEKSKWTTKCIMLARTSKASNGSGNADALQGYHSPYQLIVVDEAWGVPDVVFHALTTTLTREVNLAILIGNPTKNDGYANEAWESKYWYPIQFNLDSSNIITQESKDRIKDEYKNYPNLYRVFVDGIPPLDDENSIIRFSRINDCIALEIPKEMYENEPIILTFDPGMGGDNSVLAIRQGMKFLEFCERKCIDTDENTDFVKEFMSIYNADKVGVDAIGVGRGVYDNLRKDFKDKVSSVNFNEGRSFKEDRFKNKRSELFMKLADKVNSVSLAFPDNMRLRGELNAIKMTQDKRIIQIEAKSKIRASLGRSPGLADVCAMSMAFDDYLVKEIKNQKEDAYEKQKNNIVKRSWMSA